MRQEITVFFHCPAHSVLLTPSVFIPLSFQVHVRLQSFVIISQPLAATSELRCLLVSPCRSVDAVGSLLVAFKLRMSSRSDAAPRELPLTRHRPRGPLLYSRLIRHDPPPPRHIILHQTLSPYTVLARQVDVRRPWQPPPYTGLQPDFPFFASISKLAQMLSEQRYFCTYGNQIVKNKVYFSLDPTTYL